MSSPDPPPQLTTSHILEKLPRLAGSTRVGSVRATTSTTCWISTDVKQVAHARVAVTAATVVLTSIESCFRYTPTYTLICYEGAQYAAVDATYGGPPRQSRQMRPQRGGGRRNETNSVFTRRHQRNMRNLTSTIRTDVRAFVVTLTYPGIPELYPLHGFPTHSDQYKKHLDSFLSKLQYRYPQVGVIWRLEFQARSGAPHFHLLVFGLPTLVTESILKPLWGDTVGCVNHEQVMKALYGEVAKDVAQSLAYLSKRDPNQLRSPFVDHEGSFWGVRGKKHLPIGRKIETLLSADKAHSIRRQMRTFMSKTSDKNIRALPHDETLRQLFGHADKWLRLVRSSPSDK